jgi:hypothetical protein
MSHRKHDTSHMHDRSRGMVKETSRDRFMEERKEMEHELSHHREAIHKLMNDRYAVTGTSLYRGQYVVKFQHPESHKMEKLTFHYEPNFKELEQLWQTEQQE